mmetsp:Transcript_4144/g.12897  ORF Transcript_4144/g.12897 Transcript_4144/m.12897 type:complete len:215 (-) Transcript_4144:945-1589(-)
MDSARRLRSSFPRAVDAPAKDSAADSRSACSAACTAPASRFCFSASRRTSCEARAASALTVRTSKSSESPDPPFGSETCLLTPTTTSTLASMRACFRAAASSRSRFAAPDSTICRMPPAASTSRRMPRALSLSCAVSASIKNEPPQGSATAVRPASSCRMSCVARATRADASVGRPMASSKAFVCSDCAPPCTAATASSVVRATLFSGSACVSE